MRNFAVAVFLASASVISNLAAAYPASGATTGEEQLRITRAEPSSTSSTPRKPQTYLWDADLLVKAKRAYDAGNAPTGLNEAIKGAQDNIKQHYRNGKPLYTVTKQKVLPPSGDRHDYFSTAYYYFPCNNSPCGTSAECDNSTGLPWKRCDGHHNPDLKEGSATTYLYGLHNLVSELSLSYWYTGNADYAAEGARQLRAFFVTPSTRMNPHLEYASSRPGVTNGTHFGIIEFLKVSVILDSAAILRLSGKWTENDHQQFMSWCKQFLNWLLTSQLGKSERAYNNNHGTYFTQTALSIALHVGDKAAVKDLVGDIVPKRIEAQITEDGIFPHEMERPWSRHYEAYVLTALFRVGVLAKHAGLDIFELSKVKTAAYWPLPHLLGNAEWPYPDTKKNFDYREFGEPLMIAATQYDDSQFVQAFQHTGSGGDMDPWRPSVSLYYPVLN